MDKKSSHIQESSVSLLVQNLKKYRKERGFTQKNLAKKSGVSYATLTKIEIGVIKEPSVYICRDLSQALEISIEELIGQ